MQIDASYEFEKDIVWNLQSGICNQGVGINVFTSITLFAFLDMKKDSVVYNKSYEFGLKIINLRKHVSKYQDQVLFTQLLKSATSISANLAETTGAQSLRDFHMKISISYKESCETKHWINLLSDAGFFNKDLSTELKKECQEIVKLLSAIQLTTRRKLHRDS